MYGSKEKTCTPQQMDVAFGSATCPLSFGKNDDGWEGNSKKESYKKKEKIITFELYVLTEVVFFASFKLLFLG